MAKRRARRPHKKLALLLYMAGDNDLSEAGLRDVAELCSKGAAPNLHVGVEIDTHGELEGSIRYEITEPESDGQANRMVIERLTERDSGKPITLLEFLQWGTHRFPADQYVVVIGGHGDGFRARDRAIAVDEFGSSLDMPEIEYVLERANFHRQKIGILGFDACLMGMLEIAHHFSRFADFLVGSQQVEPGEGWPYDKVLVHLKTEKTLESVGVKIVDSYVRYYLDLGMTDITQSVIRLGKTASAMQALSRLGDELVAYVNFDTATAAGKIRQIDDVRARTQSFLGAEYVDARHLAESIRAAVDHARVRRACLALERSLSNAIAKNRVPARSKKLRNANGLSIWFPGTTFSFTVHRAKYLQMNGVAENAGWLTFLDLFFATMRNQ